MLSRSIFTIIDLFNEQLGKRGSALSTLEGSCSGIDSVCKIIFIHCGIFFAAFVTEKCPYNLSRDSSSTHESSYVILSTKVSWHKIHCNCRGCPERSTTSFVLTAACHLLGDRAGTRCFEKQHHSSCSILRAYTLLVCFLHYYERFGVENISPKSTPI